MKTRKTGIGVVTTLLTLAASSTLAGAQVVPRRPAGRVKPLVAERRDVIAFCSDRDGDFEIFLIADDGTDLHQLTSIQAAGWAPAWSPDARQIALASDRDGDYEIFVMNADGSDPRQLTHNAAYDLDPCWSPDGDRRWLP